MPNGSLTDAAAEEHPARIWLRCWLWVVHGAASVSTCESTTKAPSVLQRNEAAWNGGAAAAAAPLEETG
jgi:hypothetical protein